MFHHFYNSICRLTVGFAAACILSTGVVWADQSMTESFSFDNDLQDAPSSMQFTLPAFDSTIGTLESVELTLSLSNCSKIQIFNSSSKPESFTNASLGFQSGVQGPGNIGLTTSMTSSIPSGVAQSGMNTYGTVKTANTASQQVAGSALDLWQNQSADVVNFTYTEGNPTYQGTDLGHSLFFGGTVGGKGQLTVEYTYLSSALATPEPSAKYFSIIVAGVMALMLMRRRKLLGA